MGRKKNFKKRQKQDVKVSKLALLRNKKAKSDLTKTSNQKRKNICDFKKRIKLVKTFLLSCCIIRFNPS